MASKKPMKDHIHAKGADIAVVSSGDENDYISLTDIARYKNDAPDDVIKNWMRNRDTIEFLGLWEQLNNPEFNPSNSTGFRIQAGSNTFTMSPKSGLTRPAQSGSFLKLGDMAVHLRTGILLSSLPPGFLLSSSYTSSRTTSG